MSSLTSSPTALQMDPNGSLGSSQSVLLRHPEAGPEDHRLRVDSGTCVAETLKQESALAVLAANSVAELRFLRVDEDENEIHLSGRVRSFYHKQLAQEAIRPIAEGRRVINRVTVAS